MGSSPSRTPHPKTVCWAKVLRKAAPAQRPTRVMQTRPSLSISACPDSESQQALHSHFISFCFPDAPWRAQSLPKKPSGVQTSPCPQASLSPLLRSSSLQNCSHFPRVQEKQNFSACDWVSTDSLILVFVSCVSVWVGDGLLSALASTHPVYSSESLPPLSNPSYPFNP